MTNHFLAENYFSLWIANFGVVPWFSFLFLRFLPLFLSLSLLLHLVCIVLEAISKSLFNSIITLKFRNIVLTLSVSIVKILIYYGISIPMAHAEQHYYEEELFLAKGEQKEISTRNLENYSIGNKEVLRHKFFSKTKKIILKGAGVGFSDVIIHQKGQKPRHLKVYVTSKRSQLKRMEIAASLEKIGLEVKSYGEVIEVTGKIENLSQYLLFLSIKHQKRNEIISDVILSNAFSHQFLGQLYQDFYSAGFDSIDCQIIKIEFHCSYSGDSGLKEIVKKYKTEYFVNFLNLERSYSLKVKLHIVMFNETDSSLTSSGFKELSAPLEQLINENKLVPSSDNLLARSDQLEAYLVASPSISVLPNEKFNLRLGSEVPIVNQTPNSVTTQFKFAGLHFEGHVSQIRELFKIKFKIEVTQNNQGIFTGPRGESTFLLPLGKLKEALNIDLNEKSTEQVGIPWLSEIPIVKHLFSQNLINKNQLSLKAYVSVSEDK